MRRGDLSAKTIPASFRSRAFNVARDKQISDWTALRGGTIDSLTSPKSLLFTFAFLPQFVNPEVGPVWVHFLLGTVQKLTGVVSLGGVAPRSARWASFCIDDQDCLCGRSGSPERS